MFPCCSNNNGTLELKELMALLRDVAGLPYAEAGLVQALLDVDLSNTLTLKEWVEGIRASTDSLDAVATAYMGGYIGGAGGGGGVGVSRAQRAALTVLAAVSAQVAADLEVFWAAYARADKDGCAVAGAGGLVYAFARQTGCMRENAVCQGAFGGG